MLTEIYLVAAGAGGMYLSLVLLSKLKQLYHRRRMAKYLSDLERLRDTSESELFDDNYTAQDFYLSNEDLGDKLDDLLKGQKVMLELLIQHNEILTGKTALDGTTGADADDLEDVLVGGDDCRVCQRFQS